MKLKPHLTSLGLYAAHLMSAQEEEAMKVEQENGIDE